jgi:late competence protein required for DNA uptake (superfamily II DNA/RNA helicase)
MPLYDYECAKCSTVHELMAPYESRILPSLCCENVLMKRIISQIKLSVFKPQHFEELGDDAPYIESKEQLAKECKKRGLVSAYLEGSYNRHEQTKRWI